MNTTRRSFLGALLTAPLLGFLGGKAEAVPAKGRALLNVFSIAGLQYHQAEDVLPRLRPGELLALKAEPANTYDEFAVEIYRQASKLGYVPRSDNKHLSRLLRQGVSLVCRVLEVDTAGFPVVRVEVFLES